MKKYNKTEGLWTRNLFWFCVFGYGIHGKNLRSENVLIDHEEALLLYSDRKGLKSGTRLVMFGWMFKWLKAERRKK